MYFFHVQYFIHIETKKLLLSSHGKQPLEFSMNFTAPAYLLTQIVLPSQGTDVTHPLRSWVGTNSCFTICVAKSNDE